MPVDKPKSGETKDHYISYCIGEEIKSGREQSQAAAICYSKWDEENMAEELPAVKGGETLETYIRRCVPTIYKEGGDYDQRVATSMCADHYEGKTTEMSSVFRKIKGIKLY
jgi:hypothetical protein